LKRSRNARVRRRSRKILTRTLLAFFASGILVIAGCGAYRRARDWSIFAIRSVVVRGVTGELAPRVIEASAIETGTSMFELDLELVSRRLRSLDFVRGVRVRRRPVGRVILDVRKRVPFALVNGKVVVGEDGVEVQDDGGELAVPEIACMLENDGRGRNMVDPDLLDQAVSVFEMARELGARKIDMSHPEDLVVLLDDGVHIHLGRGDYREKLEMVSLVIGDARENNRKFSRVDARFSRQILIRG